VRGFRISEGGVVVSEAMARPGPTHSVWDLLAAAVVVLARGNGVALLGFGAGGFLAPLRAMGWSGSVDGVDLDRRGERLFHRLSSGWCGSVRFSHDEAAAWLARRKRRFHVVIDDLSVSDATGVTKPVVSFERLPALIHERLAPGGVAIVNTLRVRGMTWAEQTRHLAGAHAEIRVATFEEYENRVLILGAQLPSARLLSLRLRAALREIGSRLVDRFSVRFLQRPE
jgi:hypothetical protein